jgi:hypothetical protein
MASRVHFDLTITVTCQDAAPDLLNMWLDHQWSGIWSPCAIKSTANKDGNSSVFRVQGIMSPIALSSMQYKPNVEAPAELEVYNILKIHFFSQLPQKIERRYTCSVPLSQVLELMRKSGDVRLGKTYTFILVTFGWFNNSRLVKFLVGNS